MPPNAEPLLDAALPAGFSFWPDFISSKEEKELLRCMKKDVPFENIEMHGVVAHRRAGHFGRRYSYTSRTISEGPPIPQFLLPFRERVAVRLEMHPGDFPQALINEYTPGSAIGWHIDGPVFEVIAGFSFGGDCTFKLRPIPDERSIKNPIKQKKVRREVISFLQPARSAYVMQGESRLHWQHSISPTKELRYSVTFRSLKEV